MKGEEMGSTAGTPMKDEVLDRLAKGANVAQFVSFAPNLSLRFSRIAGLTSSSHFSTPEDAIRALLAASPEGSVNVRSFRGAESKGQEFVYGLTDLVSAVATCKRLAAQGLFVIVNETVNVEDGGVSGVAYGGICEFAPQDTPRCVEKPGTTSLSLAVAISLLERVYGFKPALDYKSEDRVEFSIHPLRRGYRQEHTIIWELESSETLQLSANPEWPNRFSRFIGDKAYGLLIADVLGMLVPRTTVVARNIAPFVFGESTGTGEIWIRTCPVEPVPGLYTTHRGWLDPCRLLAEEDPKGETIASVLAQEGVDAKFSGAASLDSEGHSQIEGVSGFGEAFMQGQNPPQRLPRSTSSDVRRVLRDVNHELGPGRIEWVHDGKRPWIVQLHAGAMPSSGNIIYPGKPAEYREFDVRDGIDGLRKMIKTEQGKDIGITVVGNVGITSHFGDLLRRARIPSQVRRSVQH